LVLIALCAYAINARESASRGQLAQLAEQTLGR
jgi:hypothetical protein